MAENMKKEGEDQDAERKEVDAAEDATAKVHDAMVALQLNTAKRASQALRPKPPGVATAY